VYSQGDYKCMMAAGCYVTVVALYKHC